MASGESIHLVVKHSATFAPRISFMTYRISVTSFLMWILLAGMGVAREAADVVVYGSTPGGFSAAIAAAREGASVILLEPTDHVGGLPTGGLSQIGRASCRERV